MNSTADFSFNTAKSYLQNVLFIDDKIFDKGDSENTSQEPISDDEVDPSASSLRNSEDSDAEQASTEESILDDQQDPPFNEREIADGFADFGIICGLLQPRESEKSGSGIETRLVKLCERADVLILDWDLYQDNGEKVTHLLTNLVESSQHSVPHHSRLCVIYTNKPSLFGVMQALSNSFQSAELKSTFDQDNLKIHAGSTLISILGKPKVVNRTEEEKARFEVGESELAERVIREFSKHHSGLLPGLALAGLAALRRNTKRLLDRLSGELDGAFLLHRGLTLGADDDALTQFPELLSEEILAVLEDEQTDSASLSQIADLYSDELPISTSTREWKGQNNQQYDVAVSLRKILKSGTAGWIELGEECSVFKGVKKKESPRGLSTELLKEVGEMVAGSIANCESLAAVFSHRTQYRENTRKLQFGTIVRHRGAGSNSEWEFSVCLMPTCDCQRLDSGTMVKFPFWQLKSNVFSGTTEKRFGTSVTDPDRVTHSLAAGGKIRDMLWIQEFEAGGEACVNAELADGTFTFSDPTGNCDIEWIAELKPLHAQRIAAEVGAKASRVGLVESEWLRLFCDR